MSEDSSPCLWLPFQLKGQKQQFRRIFLSWPLPSPAATAVKLSFLLATSPPLALQLGLSQPPSPPTPSRAEESGEGEADQGEVVWLGLQPLNPRPDCWRRHFILSRLSQAPPPLFWKAPPVLPSLCHAYTWLLLRSSWELPPRGLFLWVAPGTECWQCVPAEHSVSGRWAPHSTCVISLIPCNGLLATSPCQPRARNHQSPYNSPCRPAVSGGDACPEARSEQFSPEILGTLPCAFPLCASFPRIPASPLPLPPSACSSPSSPFLPARPSQAQPADCLLFSSPSPPCGLSGAREVMTQPWDRSNPSPPATPPQAWLVYASWLPEGARPVNPCKDTWAVSSACHIRAGHLDPWDAFPLLLFSGGLRGQFNLLNGIRGAWEYTFQKWSL